MSLSMLILIQSPKRVKDFSYLADVEVDPREISLRDDAIVMVSDEPHLEQDIDPEIQAEIDECFAYADALRDRGIDARVVVEAIDRDETETGVRGPVEVRVERVTHPVMPEDIPEPAQEGAVEATYETLGDLVQRFHDHTQAIPLCSLTERIAELERDNMRLRGTASVESQRVDRLQRGMSRMQRELRQMRRLRFYDRVRVGRLEAKMPNTRSGASMTREEFEELVNRRVAEEMEAREAARTLEPLNENVDEQEGGDSALTWWNSHKRTIGVEAAYAMNWVELMKLMTEVYCPRNEIQKMETELMVPDEEDRVERVMLQGVLENKRRMESTLRDNVAHEGVCNLRCGTVRRFGHRLGSIGLAFAPNTRGPVKSGRNRGASGNLTETKWIQDWKPVWRWYETTARAYAISGGGTNPDSNVVTDTSLCRLELAMDEFQKTNIVLRGCTLGLLGHPFDIDLMPVELGSFDVIIGMDWLAKYHALIVCDEKVVRIPYGNEVLIIRGDNYDSGSKLNIISCTKTQKYIEKGCQVYLAQVTTKKAEDKSEERRLEDVPISLVAASVARLSLLDSTSEMQELSYSVYKKLLTKDFKAGDRVYSKIGPEIWLSSIRVARKTFQRQHLGLAMVTTSSKMKNLRQVQNSIKRIGRSPRQPTEIRQFLGLAGYYRRFIKGFSKIARPITKLTQKSVKFEWGEKAEAAFQLLKQKLCSAPILALPEGSENFVVYCDASHKGLGAVLMQREKVIAYASRQLKVHEKNYTTHDLELVASVCLPENVGGTLLYGTKCVVFTDHKSLQHILDQKEVHMMAKTVG
ncbi:putative reverse transcriptase domain-containing protein [Tanacetum coccineum]|uniref:Reverse transcriptase domain-containing protein n=1 Tax=Tanacetum coccineum TaxID=301880 RepID=A0ABQ5G5W6_9ASTR